MSSDTAVLDNPTSSKIQGPTPQVSGLNKEALRTATVMETGPKPTGPEAMHNIDQELQELEVREKPSESVFHDKSVGLEPAGPHVPVSSVSGNNVKYPMSDEQIKRQEEVGQDDDSATGLLKLIKKVKKGIERLIGI